MSSSKLEATSKLETAGKATASNTSVASTGGGTQNYSAAYRSLLAKYRPVKGGDRHGWLGSSTRLAKSSDFERHFKERNTAIVKHLASGPNSQLYLGKHTVNGRDLVIKILFKVPVQEAGGCVVKRSIDYGKVNGNAANGVGNVIEFASINESFYSLVTEYYPGGSLAKMLAENGPLKEATVRGIFQAALQGLLHLHKNKTAHRNLKPENIVFTGEGRPVLIDYSSSLVVESPGNRELVLATGLPFLAPEQLSKVPYDPIVADVFSFGVCLFIALNDALPFGVAGKPHLQLETAPTYNATVEKGLSSGVKACIKEMLLNDVNRRAASATMERTEWFQK